MEALLAVEAITNPFAREAVGVLRTIPRSRRYVGRRADLMMTPFLLPSESRFSDGSFGILYGAQDVDTALRESGHHQALRLRAMTAPAGTTVPMYSLSPEIDSIVADARKPGVDAAIYDPVSYASSRVLGQQLRASGYEGVLYDSVRNPGGQCVGLFWPSAVKNVSDGFEWRFFFDGVQITEFSKVV